ncbi:phosphatase PAP2 family protein [soil metagenome]
MIPGETPLFRAINGWPDSLAPIMVWFSTAIDSLPFKLFLLVYVIVMVVRGGKARPAALLSLVAFPIANGITDLFKHGLPEHRPFQVLADVVVRTGKSESMGTASAHAANMACVATVMTLILGWRWGGIWIAVAILVGFSRVYCGVHWPSQVVLGWSIGIYVGFAAVWVYRRVSLIRERKKGKDAESAA